MLRVSRCPASDTSPAGHPFGGPLAATVALLDGDRRARALQGCLGLVGGLLVHPLEYGVRRAVHQVLGLLEAKTGQRPDFLDDLDLLVARRLQDDVELVLLLDLFGRACAARGGSLGHRDRGRGLHVEGLLELLHEVGQLEERHLLERVEQFVGAHLRHGGQSSVASSVVACAATSAAASSLVLDSSVSVAGAASAGAASAAGASASAGASAARLASRAAASLAICVGSAAIVAAARAIDAFMAPASIARSTSRDSRSASLLISDGVIDLPSMIPPLISSAGLALAKSRRPLAASTTSPLTKAIADGPV